MLRASDSGRTRWVRTLPLIAILAFMVVGAFPVAGASSLPVAAAPVGNHLASAPTLPGAAQPVATSHSASGIKAPTWTTNFQNHPSFSPSASNLTFFQNTSSFAIPNATQAGCQVGNPYGYEIQDICNTQAYDPSAVTLGNGNVGVGYTVTSNVTGTSTSGCLTGTTNSTVQEKVGFSISTDNGVSFGPIDYLGNQTCSYLDAIEPSFAVSSSGTVYGAYVEENFSGQTGLYTDNYSVSSQSYICLYAYYGTCQNRSMDAIGFTTSTNNGVTFSDPVTISSAGWIAHPQVAAFGDSVYVLYENINNYTTGSLIPYGDQYDTSPAISLELLYSSNGGATWSGPYNPPGVVGASGIAQEAGGAIAVTSLGTVAVSYFTNDTCYAVYYGYCYGEGDELVLSTSATNGTSFKGPFVLSQGWGSSPPYLLPYYERNYASNFEELPQSSIAVSPDGQTVYIAWTAPYNQSVLFGGSYSPYELYEGESGAFEATGTIGGAGFATNILMASSESYNEQFAYSIAIGANAGGVYVTYSGVNESSCYGTMCSYLGNSFFEVIQTSPDGHAWSGQEFSTFVQTSQGVYSLESDYPGIYSSVAFTAGGAPVYAYALPNPETTSYNYNTYPYYYNATYPTSLYVATNYTGLTVSLNVSENGLFPGTPWTLSVGGAILNVPAGTTNFTLTGIAIGQTIFFSAPNLNVVALEIASAAVTVTGGQAYEGAASFETNGSVYVNYTYQFGVNFVFEPANVLDAEIETVPCCTYDYYVDNFCTPTACTGGYPSIPPWYFAQGTQMEFYGYGDPLNAQFWTGSGNGSYTGPGLDANLTVNGPITEIVWYIPIGEYNVTVQAPSLPADLDLIPSTLIAPRTPRAAGAQWPSRRSRPERITSRTPARPRQRPAGAMSVRRRITCRS